MLNLFSIKQKINYHIVHWGQKQHEICTFIMATTKVAPVFYGNKLPGSRPQRKFYRQEEKHEFRLLICKSGKMPDTWWMLPFTVSNILFWLEWTAVFASLNRFKQWPPVTALVAVTKSRNVFPNLARLRDADQPQKMYLPSTSAVLTVPGA